MKIPTVTESDRQTIYNAVKGTMTVASTAELLANIIEEENKHQETEDWTPIEHITWIVSEAYCQGAIFGTETTLKALQIESENEKE